MTHFRQTRNMPNMLAETVDVAIGRQSRTDPIMPGTGGPAGNARLTAWTGMILLVLALAELITLVDVNGLLSWHVVIGTLLVPPALVKTASTGWRIVRYYRRDEEYRRAGPPPLLLRILGPGVVLSTLGLLGSGLTLVLIGEGSSRTPLFDALGQRVDWVTVHQGFFILWGVLTGLHVLARTVPAIQHTILTRRSSDRVEGGRLRAAALAGAAVIAVAGAVVILDAAGSWRHGDGHFKPHDRISVGTPVSH
jgi:hypothetical protein